MQNVMKSAGIYKDKKGYIFVPLSTTVAGFSVSTDPEIRIYQNESDDVLSETLKKTLQESKEDVPTPDFKKITEEQKVQLKEKLQRLDIKSYDSLNKKPSLYCSVKLNNDQIVFKPNALASSGQGFVGKTAENDVSVSYNGSNTEIADAFKLALSRCE